MLTVALIFLLSSLHGDPQSDEAVPEWAFDCSDEQRVEQLQEYVSKNRVGSFRRLPSLLRAVESNRRKLNETENFENYVALLLLDDLVREDFRRFGLSPGSLPVGVWSYGVRKLVEQTWTIQHPQPRRPDDAYTYHLLIPPSDLTPRLREVVQATIPFRFRFVTPEESWDLQKKILTARKDPPLDVLWKLSEVYRYRDYYWVSWRADPTMEVRALLRVDNAGNSNEGVIPLIQ